MFSKLTLLPSIFFQAIKDLTFAAKEASRAVKKNLGKFLQSMPRHQARLERQAFQLIQEAHNVRIKLAVRSREFISMSQPDTSESQIPI